MSNPWSAETEVGRRFRNVTLGAAIGAANVAVAAAAWIFLHGTHQTTPDCAYDINSAEWMCDQAAFRTLLANDVDRIVEPVALGSLGVAATGLALSCGTRKVDTHQIIRQERQALGAACALLEADATINFSHHYGPPARLEPKMWSREQ